MLAEARAPTIACKVYLSEAAEAEAHSDLGEVVVVVVVAFLHWRVPVPGDEAESPGLRTQSDRLRHHLHLRVVPSKAPAGFVGSLLAPDLWISHVHPLPFAEKRLLTF